MRTEVYIQARMRSTRLPGKVLKTVLGRPLLDYMIERLRQAQEVDAIVVLTSTHEADDSIVNFCQQHQVEYFRGSEEDVLDRYYQAAMLRQPDIIVRVTADCPLIDPEILDQAIRTFKHNQSTIDYVSICADFFPRGLDAEVFSFSTLKQIAKEPHQPEELEHVTPYIYRHPELFRLLKIEYQPFLGFHRWTVDTPEDFELIRLILENLYPNQPRFRLKDILFLFNQHPDWLIINQHIQQKQLPP